MSILNSNQTPERILYRLDWQVIRRLDGLLQGDYRSLFYGYGVDFADLREYQPDDDIRYIDWNVSARMDSLYVRQYIEDRDITAWFLLDFSPSLDFGLVENSKRTLLIDFVATFARLLTRHGNRVGAMFYNSQVEKVIPARGGRFQVLRLIRAQLKTALEPFEKIRKAVGDKMEILVEFHSLWNLPMAKKLAKYLEPYNPTWFEDPIRMNSPQALAEYARSTPVWVTASETLGSRFPFKDMLDRDAVHVVMADLCWTGGLTEGRKIAAMAETYHRPFAPHDCIGPVGFIAGIHASFSQPNTLIQESVRAFYTGWYKELVTTMPVIKDGYVFPMEGPGLGVELLPSVFERSDLTTRRTEA